MNSTASQTTGFVVSLGQALLKDKCRGWIDMEATATFCRDHEIKLDRQYLGTRELETVLKQFFQKEDEFYAPGVSVDGYSRRVGWDDVFCIRAYPYSLVEPSISTNVEQPETDNPVPVQNQSIEPECSDQAATEEPV